MKLPKLKPCKCGYAAAKPWTVGDGIYYVQCVDRHRRDHNACIRIAHGITPAASYRAWNKKMGKR